MNAILQKRIKEEAKVYSFNIPSELFHSLQTQHKRKLWKDEIEQAYIYGGEDSLQNQWISVEEALPEVDGHGYSKPVLVMSDTNELLVATYSKIYDKWNSVGPISYHRLVVTNWMPIQSLKGGEE